MTKFFQKPGREGFAALPEIVVNRIRSRGPHQLEFEIRHRLRLRSRELVDTVRNAPGRDERRGGYPQLNKLGRNILIGLSCCNDAAENEQAGVFYHPRQYRNRLHGNGKNNL